jgi:Glycosyl transferase family 2
MLFNWQEDWQDSHLYLAACDAAYSQLRRVCGLADFPSNGVTAICVVRDEADRLPAFLDHYRGLGVRQIHIIDNASSDGTGAIARAWPDTTVWYTDASYAEAVFGQLWIGAVVRRHGLGGWVLNVDADEHLVYDGMDRHNLDALCRWLITRGQTRLFAPLTDLYPRLPLLKSWARWRGCVWRMICDGLRMETVPDGSCYFDRGGLRGSPNYEFQQTAFGMHVKGGVRARVIAGANDAFCLSKAPLSLWDRDTAYCHVHFPFPFDLNPHEPHGALLHYKFVGDFQRRVSAAIRDNQHWKEAYEYKLYHEWLERQTPLFNPRYSMRYDGPASLISEGLLRSIDWEESVVIAPELRGSAVSEAAHSRSYA